MSPLSEALECRNSDVGVRSTAPLSGAPDGAGAIEVAGKGERLTTTLAASRTWRWIGKGSVQVVGWEVTERDFS